MYTGNLILLSHPHETDFAIFSISPQRVDALAWSPDSVKVAAALDNDTVSAWSIETGDESKFRYTKYGVANTVNALAWSPDGRKIAVLDDKNTVQVLSSFTAASLFTYLGHTHEVFTLAWSPDGKYIASGGADETVQVWNAKL